ncbi:MAG: hypothetical protein M1827_007281 [Pycnora praestabilis]|nr:MAG: hypothetical protein M1827_007281 [Pycnora praestabilis]
MDDLRPLQPNHDFAFAFDIDGVLLRSANALPGAHKALSYLQSHKIPFILLTNGGGRPEEERVEELSKKLNLPLDVNMFIQSHTPFAEMAKDYQERTVLVIGGHGNSCRRVAQKYGFKNVITTGDIVTADPSIWPFNQQFSYYYRRHARPITRPIMAENIRARSKIDAIFVFNDPRDWALDTQIILDLLLSKQGLLGTRSDKNNHPDLPNRGFQQDGQPPLFFSNPDLFWAAAYDLPRLGQGGFREALEGVWAAVTGGPQVGVELQKTIIGKPYQETYEFAEKRLRAHRQTLAGGGKIGPLKKVYMVGDNPESDIRGGNEYKSPHGSEWPSILVKSGVFNGGEPAYQPKKIVDGVLQAVRWGLQESGHEIVPRPQ